MEIKIKKAPHKKRKTKPADEAKLGFGKHFTDHFFNVKYKEGNGWYCPRGFEARPARRSRCNGGSHRPGADE